MSFVIAWHRVNCSGSATAGLTILTDNTQMNGCEAFFIGRQSADCSGHPLPVLQAADDFVDVFALIASRDRQTAATQTV